MLASYNSIPKILQAISYAINKCTTIPLISRMQMYDSMQNYILSQEARINILEEKILQLETKLETFEKEKRNNNKI